jgi:curli biogenesis system outer membrane secretion channel CsgG
MNRVARVGAVVLLAALVTGADEGRKMRVAALDFEYGAVRSEVTYLFGTEVDVGRGIADLLVRYLVQDGSYAVIERKMLQMVLSGYDLSITEREETAIAVQIGKTLGLDAIIVGSVTQFGGEAVRKMVGIAGGDSGGIVGAGGGKKEEKAIVTLDARLVDIHTGEVLAVVEGRGESSRSGKSFLGSGFGKGGFGSVGVDFSRSKFQETILGEAITASVEHLSAGVIAAKDKLVTHQVEVQGLVAFVDESIVVLNVGTTSGLRPGDRLSVEHVTQEIHDPDSGEVIRRMTAQIGEVEVTEADDGSAVCSVLSGSDITVGDMASTVVPVHAVKNVEVDEKFIAEMLAAARREADPSTACSEDDGLPAEVGIYSLEDGTYVPVAVELAAWRGTGSSSTSGGVRKVAYVARQHPLQSNLQLSGSPELLVVCPEGVLPVEYLLLRAKEKKKRASDADPRKFRANLVSSGEVFVAVTGTEENTVPFEAERLAACKFRLKLPPLGKGEYAFLPPTTPIRGRESPLPKQLYTFGVR